MVANGKESVIQEIMVAMPHAIVVDVDNTLWDFGSVLYEGMKKLNPAVTPSDEWCLFDFWKAFVSPRAFYSVIRKIHMEQEAFTPYADARPFLESLKEKGFPIIIASHREKGTLDATIRWLNKNSLPFDEVHLSHDKTVLFERCRAIVDDSPMTLEKARHAGIVRAGLRFPWNAGQGHPLFDTLGEILTYLYKTLAI
jgi:hypothetical protein